MRTSSTPSLKPLSSTGRHLKVCGPEKIQTLRGRMFGRDVALILCGEAHEDTIDLTRSKGILEVTLDWSIVAEVPNHFGFNVDEALATDFDLTFQDAKVWAEDILDKKLARNGKE